MTKHIYVTSPHEGATRTVSLVHQAQVHACAALLVPLISVAVPRGNSTFVLILVRMRRSTVILHVYIPFRSFRPLV